MSDLLSRLFETKPNWEKTLATKTQNLGDMSEWVESDAALQAVVLAVEDPVLGGIVTKKVESESINPTRCVMSNPQNYQGCKMNCVIGMWIYFTTILTTHKCKRFNYYSRYFSSPSIFYPSILTTSRSRPPPRRSVSLFCSFQYLLAHVELHIQFPNSPSTVCFYSLPGRSLILV